MHAPRGENRTPDALARLTVANMRSFTFFDEVPSSVGAFVTEDDVGPRP